MIGCALSLSCGNDLETQIKAATQQRDDIVKEVFDDNWTEDTAYRDWRKAEEGLRYDQDQLAKAAASLQNALAWQVLCKNVEGKSAVPEAIRQGCGQGIVDQAKGYASDVRYWTSLVEVARAEVTKIGDVLPNEFDNMTTGATKHKLVNDAYALYHIVLQTALEAYRICVAKLSGHPLEVVPPNHDKVDAAQAFADFLALIQQYRDTPLGSCTLTIPVVFMSWDKTGSGMRQIYYLDITGYDLPGWQPPPIQPITAGSTEFHDDPVLSLDSMFLYAVARPTMWDTRRLTVVAVQRRVFHAAVMP